MSAESLYARHWLEAHLNYSAAWGLVQTLTALPRGLDRLDTYLETLHAGQRSEEQAWHEAFGDVSESELESRFRSFLSARETVTWRAKLAYQAVPPLTERVLTASESHTLLAELHDASAEGKAKARKELEQAIAADPRNPEPYFLRASLEFSSTVPEKVRPDLERARSLAPQEGRYAAALAELDFHVADGDGELKALGASMTRLLPLARRAFEYDVIARYSLATGRRAAAQKYATKALQADSSCFFCFATAAEVAFSEGKQKLAIQLQKTAINLLPHGVSSKHYSERLAAMEAPPAVPVERHEPAAQ
jgi:tetratricopeptide (TPR) repeat protein